MGVAALSKRSNFGSGAKQMKGFLGVNFMTVQPTNRSAISKLWLLAEYLQQPRNTRIDLLKTALFPSIKITRNLMQ